MVLVQLLVLVLFFFQGTLYCCITVRGQGEFYMRCLSQQ